MGNLNNNWDRINEYYASGQGNPEDRVIDVNSETNVVDMEDSSGGASLYSSATTQVGKTPVTQQVPSGKGSNSFYHTPVENADGSFQIRDVNANRSQMEAQFTDANGAPIPYNGNFDMYGSSGVGGEFNSGQFNFNRTADTGDWSMDGPFGSSQVSNEFVDKTYANQMRKLKNMTDVDMTSDQTGVQDLWEAANPLALGDTNQGGGGYSGSGDGTENNPYQYGTVNAQSSNEYLQNRNSLSSDNIPTGTGGTGDGMFSFLKDFNMFGKG